MNKIIKFLSLVLLSFLAFPCFAQKQVKYEYYGGHGCVDNTLTLYSDSSYVYTSSTALPFSHTSTRSGYYLLSDSSITLFQKKKMPFLYSKHHKYESSTFRVKNKDILMYTAQDELSKDSSFIKAYQTMRFLSE